LRDDENVAAFKRDARSAGGVCYSSRQIVAELNLRQSRQAKQSQFRMGSRRSLRRGPRNGTFGHQRGIEILREAAKGFICKTKTYRNAAGRTAFESRIARRQRKKNGRGARLKGRSALKLPLRINPTCWEASALSAACCPSDDPASGVPGSAFAAASAVVARVSARAAGAAVVVSDPFAVFERHPRFSAEPSAVPGPASARPSGAPDPVSAGAVRAAADASARSAGPRCWSCSAGT